MEEDNFIHYIDINESDTQAAANRYSAASIERLHALYSGRHFSPEAFTLTTAVAHTSNTSAVDERYNIIQITNPEVESLRQEIVQLKKDMAELKKILRNTIDNSFTPEHRKITL